MRVNYSDDVPNRDGHWSKMKTHYGAAVRGKDLKRGKHTGHYVEVDSIKSGIELAIADKACGMFFIFEADNVETEKRRVLVEGFIGEVKAFSKLSLNSAERKNLLSEGWTGPEMTHVIYERGEIKPRYTGEESLPQIPVGFEIYTPKGEKVWPVDPVEILREKALKAKAVASEGIILTLALEAS